ncbi:hypothetical protein [Mycetocola sp. 2940]|uniref:hypothetical protein n=1 Tax=Mycetocola sp. 2940 TaxID=3156452 RepID=UPI003395C8D8
MNLKVLTSGTRGTFRITTVSGSEYLLVNEEGQPVTLTRIPHERPDAEPLPKDREPVPVIDFDTVRVGEEATFRLQPESRKSKPVSRITTTVVELVHIEAAAGRTT